jgi:hypothetical protein
MDVPPLLIQTLGSLVAIALLAGLAALLKLGGNPKLGDEADVARIANEIADGFQPCDVEVSRDGSSALARDPAGQVMVIKRHGNRFAGRILGVRAAARREGDVLVVECGERRFGAVSLEIDKAASWEAIINAISAC